MGIHSHFASRQTTTINLPKMFSKAAVLISALATAQASAPIVPVHPAPVHPLPVHPVPVVHAPVHGYTEPPKPYAFEYGVHNDYSGANFEQHENSDTKLVSGNYRVALPDGRIQIVDYHADVQGYGGYVADVKHDGVAHPPPVPVKVHPAPIHPVPVHPVPVHPIPVHPAVPVHPIHA